MKVDLTRYIISRNRQYLVGIPYYCTLKPRWSNSPYDAARIKNANDARAVAKKVGGNVHRFNPLNGEVV